MIQSCLQVDGDVKDVNYYGESFVTCTLNNVDLLHVSQFCFKMAMVYFKKKY